MPNQTLLLSDQELDIEKFVRKASLQAAVTYLVNESSPEAFRAMQRQTKRLEAAENAEVWETSPRRLRIVEPDFSAE